MKHRFVALSTLLLGALSLSACSDAKPGAATGTGQPAAPASSTAAPQAQTASAPAAGAESAKNPAANPANARQGHGKADASASGASTANKDKLDTGYDLSKVKLPPPVATEGDPEDDEVVRQDGSSLLPAAQADRNRGHISLQEGAAQAKDLGKVRQGDRASFEFQLLSDGEDALVITGVKPSCGCTKADIELLGASGEKKAYTKGDPIPAGTKFVLETEINTDGKPQGPFNAQVSIYANDARGAFNVRLTAEVEAVLTIKPSPTVFFGRITTADTVEQSVTVESTRGEPFLLSLGQESVQTPVKLEFSAQNPAADGKSSQWQIKVTLGPNTDIGMRNYPINFKSDLPIAQPKYPSPDGSPQFHGFMLNVQAQVTGMVSAEPSFITFGMVRPGEALERALRIECHDAFKLRGDMPVSFEGLTGEEFQYKDLFKVSIEPLEDGKFADVKVRLEGLPADLNGSFGGVIKIKVGHPYIDELAVRFSGVCRPGLPAPTAPAGGQGGQ